MNVRRHAAIGSAVLTGAFLVAACGSTSTPTSSSPAGTATGTPTAAAVQTGNPTSAVTLTEDGSSLLYPYLQKLQSGITTAYPNITLSAAAGGSGKGQTDAISGAVTMGGSDAYLSPGQVTANPGLLNVPIAVSAQAVNYNLAGHQQPQAERRRDRPDLLGHHHHLERPEDRRPQPRRHPPADRDRAGAPGRLLG